MYVQYSAGLPGVIVDDAGEKIIFNTTSDLARAMEAFYERYLAEDVDAFGLSRDYAVGFYAMMDMLRTTRGDWAKGQVIGPVSFGLTVTDQDFRASLYNELLADVIVKHLAMNARWQVRQLLTARPNIVLFVDEPYLASFGSAYVALNREQVIAMLDEVFDAIHQEGALAGVHCCGNTDWSAVLATGADIVNLDAYDYLDSLALYPVELRAFLDRGGYIAWGIVPNDDRITEETPARLAQRLHDGMSLISSKAKTHDLHIHMEELADRSLLTTSCGLRSATVEMADRALEVLVRTAQILRET